MPIIPRILSVTKSDGPASRKKATSGRAFSAPAKPVRSRVTFSSWIGTGSVLGIAAIFVSLGFYIYTINASVSKGFELKKQQAAIDTLNETQKRLMVQQAALGSIVKVNDVASTAGMVPVTGEEFLVANQLSAR